MASINGICVKGIKDFKGHEGEPLCQGNLYLNNKKIGFWSQDSWGGPDHFILDQGFDYRLLNDAVKTLNAEKSEMVGPAGNQFLREYDLEYLMIDLLDLNYDEKAFKNAVKKGYSAIVVATDGYNQVVWNLPQSYLDMSNEGILKVLAKEIKNATESTFFKNREITTKIYRSLDEFNIGKPIQPEEIKEKPALQNAIDSCEKMSNEKLSAKDKGPSDRETR